MELTLKKAQAGEHHAEPLIAELHRRQGEAASLWFDALDASILEHGSDGPKRVLDAALEIADRARLKKEHKFVYEVCKRMKREDIGFAQLLPEEQDHLASLAIVGLEDPVSPAQHDRILLDARDRAARAVASKRFQETLAAEGPSRGADELLAKLKRSSASAVRKARTSR